MSDLPTVKVSECCDILDNLRIPLNAEEREKIKGNIPYCGANGIQGYISEYIFDEDLILLAEDGGNFDEYQTRPIAYRISGKSWVNNHAHVLRAKEGYDFSFVFYSLQHKNLIPFIKGGTRAKLNQAELREITIWDAPFPIQQRIGEIIETIDNQIDATQALIDKYTAIKQGMMADLFSRGIDPETKALRPTFEEAPELYHKTPLGILPKEWDVKTLREYTTLLEQGWSPDCESEPAFEGEWGVLKTSAVVWEGYLPGENKRLPRKLKPKDKYEVYPGDVLITRAGPGSRVGVVAFVNTTPKRLMLSDKLYRLRFDSRLDGMFASYLLSCELVQSQLNKVKTGLAESQANISQEIVMSLRIAVPNADEQKAITDKVRSAENYLNLEREHLDKLLAQKAGLMQDLLTGKVPVPA